MKVDIGTLDAEQFNKILQVTSQGMCAIQAEYMKTVAQSTGTSFAMFAAREAMCQSLAVICSYMNTDDAEEVLHSFAEEVMRRVEALKVMQ